MVVFEPTLGFLQIARQQVVQDLGRADIGDRGDFEHVAFERVLVQLSADQTKTHEAESNAAHAEDTVARRSEA
jgi:hypothetical protein